MDPKRKRIYIFVIIGCVLASIIVLLWGFGGGGGSVPTLPSTVTSPSVSDTTSTTTAPTTSGTPGQINYSAPAVFPASNSFDSSVLDSDQFKSLQPYQAIQIQSTDLGRDNPFSNY